MGGGDLWGARQVNLEPGDRPADVYTAVADLVKASIAEDAANGHEKGLLLKDKISRKVVKQTVMTNVYGVTFVGAKAQVKRQLQAAHPDLPNNDSLNPGTLAGYVATKIFTALSTMFKGAHDIQYWLGECATRISTCLTPEQIARLESEWPRLTSPSPTANNYKAASVEELAQFKSSVIWTTPLHLPVVQPYRNSKSKTIKTNMQKLSLSEPQVWDPVSKRKQLQAFPPNFIHSLDATHMLLSALKCSEVGMTFAAIHDSFWTHACDVDRLNSLLRDAFVEMHGEDIVGRLREEFQTRDKGCMHLATVNRDSKVGKKIIEYRQEMKEAFKKVGSAELSLEFERMQLLESEDAEERKKGEEMVTPGSIFASEGDESAFLSASELEGQELGHMPEQSSTPTERDAIDDPAAAAESPEGIVGGSVLDKDTEALAEEGSEIEDDHKPVQEQVTTTTKEKQATKSKKHARKIHVWLPMTFPEVPAKGAFNVKDTLASKYFFH